MPLMLQLLKGICFVPIFGKKLDRTEASLDETSVSALKDFSKLSMSEGLTENKVRADLVQLSEGVRAVGYLRENGWP